MFKHVRRIENCQSLASLRGAVEDWLIELGGEHFVIGLVSPRARTKSTVLLDNLGPEWWAAARGAQTQQTRREFVRIVLAAREPTLVPRSFHDPANARLRASDQYYREEQSIIIPTTTPEGTGYLVVSHFDAISPQILGELKALVAVALNVILRLMTEEKQFRLTPREREVLGLASRGMTTAEIAGELGLSERTIIAHVDSAGRRLDTRNRTAAVAMAVRLGLI